MEPKKRAFHKAVPVLPGAGDVWHKRYLEGNDFTSDLGKNTRGTGGGVQWVEEVNGAEEMNIDEETILKRLPLNDVEDT